MFLSTFDVFRHHFDKFEFWSKNRIFWIFRPKKRLRGMRHAALFKRKISPKNGYKLFKIFIFENYRRFRCVLHTLWLYNSSYMLRIGPLCVRHENATISLKNWFSPKNRDFGRKCHLSQVTLKRHSATNIGP